MTPPTAEQIQQAWDDPKLANLLYHDWEADTYDDKWSISFDDRCITYATDRFRAVAGEGDWPYGSALELGCGTGFFLLNLKLGGVLDEGHVTDLSPGMVEVAKRNGAHLGFDLEGRVADAETLPYPDESFDLVIGHAVLHHIPDLEQAMRTVRNNLANYHRLLGAFIDGHGDDDRQLAAARREERLEDARRLAHSLKGVAGTLGLCTIHAAACRLNDALLADPPASALATAFAELELALQQTCAAIRDYRQANPDPR